MIKLFLKSLIRARKFNMEMDVLNARPRRNTIKVRLTEDQMYMLRACALYNYNSLKLRRLLRGEG